MNSNRDETQAGILAEGHGEVVPVLYAPDGCHLYEVVGKSLVRTDLMQRLIDRTYGKFLDYQSVISIPKFCGEKFISDMDEEELAIVGECLAKLINTGRILIKAPTELQG